MQISFFKNLIRPCKASLHKEYNKSIKFCSNNSAQDTFTDSKTQKNFDFACKIIQNYLNKGYLTFSDIKKCVNEDISVVELKDNSLIAAISQNGSYKCKTNTDLVEEYLPDSYTLFVSDPKNTDIEKTIHSLIHEYTHYLQMEENKGLFVEDIIESLKLKNLNKAPVVNSFLFQTKKSYQALEQNLKSKLINNELNMTYDDIIKSTKPLKTAPLDILRHTFNAKDNNELKEVLKNNIENCINDCMEKIIQTNPSLQKERNLVYDVVKKQIYLTIKIEFEANREAFLVSKEINEINYPCLSDVVVALFGEMLSTK